jgi:imidazolonepropionase-like amidohydrolase
MISLLARADVSCLLAFFVAVLGLAPALAADLVIENVTIVSPEQAKPVGPRHVLIRDGRIASVSDKAIAAKGAQRLNGRGKFLTPGIMDSHVHVGEPVGVPDAGDDLDLAALHAAFFRQQPRSYLYFGVTQVLDTNSNRGSAAAFESEPQHPDLFGCGAAMVLDGYPMVFVPAAVRHKLVRNWVYEPANASKHPLPPGVDAKDHTPEAVVERIAASGVRCVKLFIEDGFGPRSDWPLMSEELQRRVYTAAHAKGLLVIAHGNAIAMQQRALASGVDVFAHGIWHWDAANAPKGIPEPVAAHLRTIHARKIGYQATLRVIYGEADLFRHDTLKDPMYAKVVPPDLLKWYATDAGQWFKKELTAMSDNAPDEKIMHNEIVAADRGMRAVKFLHDLGHPLLVGSDTPSGPIYGNQPGYDTYREMRAMAQAGIPLDAIFRAATINNARQFGLDRDYGTVQTGKIANLLLLNSNPLETVRAWSMIDKIVLHGSVIDRETLAADLRK